MNITSTCFSCHFKNQENLTYDHDTPAHSPSHSGRGLLLQDAGSGPTWTWLLWYTSTFIDVTKDYLPRLLIAFWARYAWNIDDETNMRWWKIIMMNNKKYNGNRSVRDLLPMEGIMLQGRCRWWTSEYMGETSSTVMALMCPTNTDISCPTIPLNVSVTIDFKIPHSNQRCDTYFASSSFVLICETQM